MSSHFVLVHLIFFTGDIKRRDETHCRSSAHQVGDERLQQGVAQAGCSRNTRIWVSKPLLSFSVCLLGREQWDPLRLLLTSLGFPCLWSNCPVPGDLRPLPPAAAGGRTERKTSTNSQQHREQAGWLGFVFFTPGFISAAPITVSLITDSSSLRWRAMMQLLSCWCPWVCGCFPASGTGRRRGANTGRRRGRRKVCNGPAWRWSPAQGSGRPAGRAAGPGRVPERPRRSGPGQAPSPRAAAGEGPGR